MINYLFAVTIALGNNASQIVIKVLTRKTVGCNALTFYKCGFLLNCYTKAVNDTLLKASMLKFRVECLLMQIPARKCSKILYVPTSWLPDLLMEKKTLRGSERCGY